MQRSREKSQRHASFNSVALLFTGTILGAGLAFATQVLLARTLSVAQFGAFAAALATVNLLAPLTCFGVAGYWLNVYGREGWQAQRWLPASFRFIMLCTTVMLFLLLAWAWLGPHDGNTSWLLTVLSLHVLGQATIELTSARFQLEGNYAALAGWQFTPHLLRFVGVSILLLLFVSNQLTALSFATVFALAALLLFAVGGYQLLLMAKGRIALEGHGALIDARQDSAPRPDLRKVFSASWPFGLGGIFYLIYFQSDIILIKYLVDDTAVGIYNIAFVVMAAVYLVPSVIYRKFLLPRLHRWAHHDLSRLFQVYRIGNRMMFFLGLSAMASLWLLAPYGIPRLFGEAYHAAVPLLMILAAAAPFRFVASSVGAILTTRHHMRIKVRLMGSAALLNIVLNLVLIPQFGAHGAASATVLTEAVSMILYFLYFRLAFREEVMILKP